MPLYDAHLGGFSFKLMSKHFLSFCTYQLNYYIPDTESSIHAEF
jgi:hypothetical protein